MEEVKVEVKAEETKPEPVQEPVKDDLITRVSKVEVKPDKIEVREPEFDFKNIESIQDPTAKEQAMLAYKSFQKGFNQKFQEIAELRKSLEAQKQQTTSWTPEKLQQEMSKPDFVQAAQSVIKIQNPEGSGLTDNEWSTLSEGEKNRISKMEQELNSLKQQSFIAEIRSKAMIEDEQLKTKYADYDPKAIDTVTADMLAGRLQATREHLYKAMKFEEAVRKAYELGKSDRKLESEEKITSMSPTGTVAIGSEAVPEPEQGETNRAYFQRLAKRRLQQAMAGQMKK